ncbi:MAG: hypothetical protein WAW02_00420 [Sideroxyarcus sp.]
MSHENSQFDISAIQLRESKTQPKVSLSREIGEAQITHTIFGKAKVRIIRKGDQARRTLLLSAIAIAAVAAAAWQGWPILQQTDPVQNTDLAAPASAVAQAGAAASQSENVAPLAGTPSVHSEPLTPSASGITPPVVNRENMPQQTNGLKGAGQMVAKPVPVPPKPVMIKPQPVTVEPSIAGKPQTVPTAIVQPQNPLPPKLLPAKRPAAPAVVIPPAVQSAASSPAVAAPPAVPLGKEDTAAPSPMDDTQLSAPINASGN